MPSARSEFKSPNNLFAYWCLRTLCLSSNYKDGFTRKQGVFFHPQVCSISFASASEVNSSYTPVDDILAALLRF